MIRNSGNITPAKIRRPHTGDILVRERLYTMLDRERRKPMLWIMGPAGSGKSTLASGWIEQRNLSSLWYQMDDGDVDPATFIYYLGLAAQQATPRKKRRLPLLTPEYAVGMSTFARRFFEELFCRLSPPYVLVFDNYQEIPSSSPVHDLLLKGLEVIPDGITMIMISRSEPPAQFTRLKANKKMGLIGWNAVRFTLGEVREAVDAARRGRCLQVDCPGPVALFEKSNGWAAGLQLMIEASEPQREIVRSSQSGVPFHHCIESLNWQEDVFSYFASEVMLQTDPAVADFLVSTSLLPFMTPAIAASLSGRADAQAILSRLSRRHYFTEWCPGEKALYRYHPLFREFLRKQAHEKFPAEVIAGLEKTAALHLEEEGFFDDALEMYLTAGEFEPAVPLIIRNAWGLLSQGRGTTVDNWLSLLPPDLVAANPALLQIAGLCRMTGNMADARAYLEKAFHLHLAKKDFAAAVQVCGLILETIIVEGSSYEVVDFWIDSLNDIVKKHHALLNGADAPVTGIVLFALAYRDLNHRSLPFWLEKAEAAVLKISDVAQALKLCNHLMAFHLFSGDYHSVTRIMTLIKSFKAKVAQAPVLSLLSLLLEAYHANYALGSAEQGIALARKGIELGRETGIVIYEFWFSYLIVAASVSSGDQSAAEEWLSVMMSQGQGASPVRRGDLHLLSGAVALGRGAWSEAARHFRLAVEAVQEAGVTYSTAFYRVQLCRAMFEMGREKEVRLELASIARMKWAYSHMIRYMGLLTQAYCDLKRGEREKARRQLRDAFSIAKSGGMLIAPFWNREQSALVCAEALDAGIEPEFVRTLIRTFRLDPPDAALASDAWPWPLKIYTFGRFEVLKNGEPLVIGGVVQKKPVELLKALIALGGRDVSEDIIADALWPDADGDTVRSTLKTALHRLRQSLGDDRFIRLKNNKLSLSEQHCWVDVMAFQHAANLSRQSPASGKNVALGKALQMYQGPFLPDDHHLGWSAAMRERTRRRFITLLDDAAGVSMAGGDFLQATVYYENAVDIDELDEDMYARLMKCYGILGRKDKIANCFSRCRLALGTAFNVEPSDALCGLYTRLMKE